MNRITATEVIYNQTHLSEEQKFIANEIKEMAIKYLNDIDKLTEEYVKSRFKSMGLIE